MKGLFDMFDFDQSGDISVDEIQKIMRLAGKKMTLEEIKTMISEDDRDHNQQIDLDEFCGLMKKQISPTQKFDELERVFNEFTRPNTNYIDEKDLKRVFVSLGWNISMEDCLLLVEMFEVGHNGRIYFSQFVKFLMAQ